MERYRRFKLIRDYTCPEGTLQAGSDIDLLGDRVLYNGGMVEPQYRDILLNLITDGKLSKVYIKEVPIPYNKI